MKPALPNTSLVPFVVAVTGHRDLRPQDLERLTQEVERIFVSMHKRMPSTPLLLLTGLAEGADQLVAELAHRRGVALAAVLPMPLEIYRTTMSPEARQKLDVLLAHATVRITLPLEGSTREEILASDQARAACYERLALFLAQHGQALIALWDGVDARKPGGTASVVHSVRSGVPDRADEQPESRCGVVYHLSTPRISSPSPAPPIRLVMLGCEPHPGAIHPAAQAEHQHAKFLRFEKNLERFNHAAKRFSRRPTAPGSRLLVSHPVALSPFQKRLERLYGTANAISIRANGHRKLLLSLILATAVSGTLFYGVHGEILGQRVWLWFSFPFFVLVALLLHRIASANHVEEKYLDARALAEALRVQFFWELSGIKQSVDRYYLANRRTELDWIRFALKNIWLLHQDDNEPPLAEPNIRLVLETWIKGQQKWYGDKAIQQSRSVRLRERISHHAILAAVAWSILVPASILIHGPWHDHGPWKNLTPEDWKYQTFHILLAAPALIAGAYRLWIEQAGYEEQSREYRYMEHQFILKAKELEENLHSHEIAKRVLLELGMEALKENGRWLLLHRERPLEVLSSP